MATQQAAPTGQSAGAAGGATTVPGIDLSNPDVAAAYANALKSGGSSGVSLYSDPGGYADPKAKLYQGQQTRTDITAPKGSPYERLLGRQMPPVATVSSSSVEGTVDDTLKAFYKMSPDELSRTQRLLFAGGFFGNANLTDVPFGIADESSFAAWARAVSRAARMYGAGQNVTVDDVLVQAARAGGVNDPGTSGSGGGGNKVVSLTDPASLRATLDSAAQAIIGRKANLDEQRLFVALMHGMQSGAQLAAQGGGGTGTAPAYTVTEGTTTSYANEGTEGTHGGPPIQATTPPDVSMEQLQARAGTTSTVVATQPSPEAQAAEMLRRQNPEEAGAHDVATQFDNFIRLLKGVVG